MHRRTLLAAMASTLFASVVAVRAQSPQKVARVGLLVPGDGARGAGNANGAAFERGLRDLGWIEGQNLTIERRYASGSSERYRELALELVQAKVDVIVAGGGPTSLRAAQEATKTVPIVMVASSRDPVADGLVKSFAHPEGNITGIVSIPAEGGGKLLEILKQAVPAVSRVGVLWDRTISPYRATKALDAAARTLGVELVGLEVGGPEDFAEAMASAKRARVEGLLVSSTPMMNIYRKEIADLAKAQRLPTVALFRAQAEAGLLTTYGPSLTGEFRSAAAFVDKILRGAKPGDLPIEQPTTFELVVNLGTARAIGITIPPALLVRADEVIQ